MERTQAYRLAYDRPSQLMLNFLWKYYNLTDFIVQNNNFVVFNEYFRDGVTNDVVVEQRKTRLGIDPTKIFSVNEYSKSLTESMIGKKKLCFCLIS